MQVLENIITKLERQKSLQRDLVVPSKKIFMDKGIINVESEGHMELFRPNELFATQIAGKLGIPVQYYRKMQELTPDLLDENVNGWLDHHAGKSYLMRGYESEEGNIGTGRAFLSDRYHIIDNYEVLFAGLEAIKATGVDVVITKAEVTDRRLYLHVVCPEIEYQAEAFLKEYLKENNAAGNGIVSGFVMSNSEVGEGTFEIRPRAVICKCNNGLVIKDDSYKRIHLGQRMDAGEVVWSERTRQKNHELIMSQTEDAIKTFLSKDYVGRMVERIAEQSQIDLKHPIDTVQNVTRQLGITEQHKQSILNYFLRDGKVNAGGVMHAVTREAQNMHPDLQHDVEQQILEILPRIAKFDKPFSKN